MGAINPATCKVKPSISGPGTQAIFEIDLFIPKMLPCFSFGVLFEIKLGITVLIIPLPIEIIVIAIEKTMMLLK